MPGAAHRASPATVCVVRRGVVVYRSRFRLLVTFPFGLVVLSAGAVDTPGDPPGAIIAALGLFVVAYAIWPRLRVTRSGVEVRNLQTVAIAWRDLRRPKVEPQLPYLGRWWQRISSGAESARGGPGIGKQGYPGLVLRSHTMGVVPVLAVQCDVLGLGHFAERVARELQAARRAASHGADPIEMIRQARRGRTPYDDE